MDTNLIQVLWVEDDPTITQIYPLEAAHFGIQLVPFCCWEDAEKALIEDFKRWSAIVLDAKCKYKPTSHDNAAIFLTQAIHAIDTICARHHRVLPWYVLSGGSEDELNDLIIDSREEWDGDWKEKKYYSKTTDREMLFSRIPYHARMSPEMQIRLVYYADVFKAVRRAQLDEDIECYLEDLLLPIHARNQTGKDYNDQMTKVRKCVEIIFQSMAKNGLLPNQQVDGTYKMHNILEDIRGGINTTWCSKIIAGKSIMDKNGERVIIKSEMNLLPNVHKESFQRLIEISAAYEHAENPNATDEQKANSRQTASYLASIGNAPYLLRGMVMDLCCIILWYDSYLMVNNDVERNACNWEVL